ncbi:hypothetical protein, partial [Puniceicoccus vermicola]|uniref:hypothetical protein n=1 Tax=Puniceicoccus vermicola TaxID=388746 RepID=UPI003CCCA32C
RKGVSRSVAQRNGVDTIDWMELFFEEVTVASRAFQEECIRFISINQNPVSLNVAVSGAHPLADQGMIAMLFFERRVCGKYSNDITKLLEVLSPFLQALNILLELAGLDDRLHSLPAVN